MAIITVSGTLPSVIVENTTATGWAGTLALSGNTAAISAIQVVGTGGSYFRASYDAIRKLALLTPAAKVDYEMFRELGLTPQLDVQLQFDLGSGVSELAPKVYRIVVRDVDDTPPSGLAFSTGGSVSAGTIGSVIGTLRVTDVDTTGPFYFSFADADSWKYQVDGTTLRLRDGISLGLDDVGTMALPIRVSDGTNSAAFALNVTVSAPGGQAELIHYLLPGDFTNNFWYTAADSVSSMHASSDVSYLQNYGQDVHALMFRDGSALWLPAQVQVIHFTDGWIDLRHNGSSALVMALYHTILKREPDPVGYANLVQSVEGGMSMLNLTNSMLASAEYLNRIGSPDNATFINGLYQDALGRAADTGGYAFQLARLNSGVSRTQMVDDFAFSQESLNRLAATHPDGFWGTLLYGKEVAMAYAVGLGRGVDPGGLATWTTALLSGTLTLGQLAAQIGGSQEFLGQYAALSDAEFVTTMYHNALHRDPDPGGFSYWIGQLASHTLNRSDLVNGFAYSQENFASFNQQPGGLDLFHV